MSEFTEAPGSASAGDLQAAEDLLPLIYGELRRIAAHKIAKEAPGHTLQATALVHEAWLRLDQNQSRLFANRARFISAAAEAMRRILVDRARRRSAAKRGGGAEVLDLDQVEISSPASNDDELLALNDALEKLSAHDPGKAELVKLRYFMGMTFEEAASALGIAVPTAKQWWAYARAWLNLEIRRTAS